MEVKRGDNKFYIGEDEKDPKAVLEFRPKSDGVIEAYHTLVKEELEGKGVAGKLFDELIAYAKEENLKIIPSCSYVDYRMKKDDKCKELIAE